jgi:hypothetical protein
MNGKTSLSEKSAEQSPPIRGAPSRANSNPKANIGNLAFGDLLGGGPSAKIPSTAGQAAGEVKPNAGKQANPNAEVAVAYAESISEEEYSAITGLPPETLPPGMLMTDLDSIGSATLSAPKDTLPPGIETNPEGTAGRAGQAAAAAAAWMTPSPLSLVPPNATGIMWVQGHLSIFAKVDGQITVRGYRAKYGWYLGESLPGPLGEWFSTQLNLGVPGTFKNDILLTRAPGSQTAIYVPVEPGTAAEFRDLLSSTEFGGTYQYSPPRPDPSVGGDPGKYSAKEQRMYEMLRARTGEARATVCRRNCTTVPAEQVAQAIGTTPQVETPLGRLEVTTGRTAASEPNPYEAGRASRMREYMAKPDLSKAKPGATRIGMTPNAVRVTGIVRIGGGIWMVYGGYESVNHLIDAWENDEFGTALAQEGASWGGGWAGGEIGAAIGEELGRAVLPLVGGEMTGWLVLGEAGLVIVAAYLGAKGAGAIVDAIINFPIIFAEILPRGVRTTMDVLEEGGHLVNRGLVSLFIKPVIVSHERAYPINWDLRRMPPALASATRQLGDAAWAHLGSLAIDDFRMAALQTFAQLGVGRGLAERVALELSAAGFTYSTDEVLALHLLGFVQLLCDLKLLRFIKDPEVTAENETTDEGYKADEQLLNVRMAPLVATRASINPNNWDLSEVATYADESRDLGHLVWDELKGLDAKELGAKLPTPLKDLGITEEEARAAAQELSAPLGGDWTRVPSEEAPAEIVAEYTQSILNGTAEDFVALLQRNAHLQFRQSPGSIARASVLWMRAGYQPW